MPSCEKARDHVKANDVSLKSETIIVCDRNKTQGETYFKREKKMNLHFKLINLNNTVDPTTFARTIFEKKSERTYCHGSSKIRLWCRTFRNSSERPWLDEYICKRYLRPPRTLRQTGAATRRSIVYMSFVPSHDTVCPSNSTIQWIFFDTDNVLMANVFAIF